MLLAKEPSKLEVVNDANGTLIALYRNIQYHLPALLDEIRWAANSRQVLLDFIAQPGLTEMQRVARWFVRNHISFGGNLSSFAVTRTGPQAFSGNRRGIVKKLLAFRRRMEKVTIEHLDYSRFLELYDSADTFFFLDPPYLDADSITYDGWDKEQLQAFRNRVSRLKGRWVVTLNDSPFTRELFAGCRIRATEIANGGAKNTAGGSRLREILITPGK